LNNQTVPAQAKAHFQKKGDIPDAWIALYDKNEAVINGCERVLRGTE